MIVLTPSNALGKDKEKFGCNYRIRDGIGFFIASLLYEEQNDYSNKCCELLVRVQEDTK